MILTIAIPTYNRPDKVRRTLLRIIPQITNDVFIRVLDNHSEVVVSDYVASDIPETLSNRVEIIRHPLNIGGDANFQRCFELCHTPFIWLLGDDDDVDAKAVEIILDEIKRYQHEDLIGINFKSNCLGVDRSTPVTIKSIKDLGEKLDHFGNWLFISTSVYKTSEYLKYLRYQAWGTYALASQLVAPLLSISAGKTFVLSEKYIVTNIKTDNPEQQWSDIQVTLAVLSLLEAPVGFKEKEYIQFGKKLNTQFVSFTDLLCAIVKSVDFHYKLIDSYHRYLYNQIFHRTIKFRINKTVSYVSYLSVLFLLRNTWLLNWLVKFNKGLRNRITDSRKFHLFER